MAYPHGRARLWWTPRNRRLDRHNFLMPAVPLTTVLEYPPNAYCIDAPPPPYSFGHPLGRRMDLFRNTFIPPVYCLTPEDADCPEGEARASPARPWRPVPVLAIGSLSSPWPLSPSDYEPCGARPRTSAAVECGPQRAEDAGEAGGAQPGGSASRVGRGPQRDDAFVAPPYVPPPAYSVVDLHAPRAPSAPLGNPGQPCHPAAASDDPPRHSAMASPAFSLEDPPPYNADVSSRPLVLPSALDSPSAAQFQHSTLGSPGSPPTPLAATTAAPVLESVVEADEPDLPPPGLWPVMRKGP